MSDGERRGTRRRRKRSGPFAAASRLLRKRGARVAGVVGLAVVVLGGGVVLLRGPSEGSAAPTGRAYHMARLALGAGDLETALSEARQAVDDEPDSRDARLLLALVLQRSGDPNAARDALADDIKRDLDYDAGRELLAAVAMEDEDYATALVVLREAVEREPTPVGAWRMLAEIRTRTGDHDGAVAALKQAVDSAPDDLASWLALGDVELALALDSGSGVARQNAGAAYREAERIARRLTRSGGGRDAGLALAKSLAGQARALRGTSLADAEAELVSLVDAAGGDVEPTLSYAGFLAATGRVSEARTMLVAAEGRWPGPAPRRALAAVLESVGEQGEAVAALRRAVASDPRDVASRVALVELLVRAERFDDAAAELGGAPEDVAGAGRLHEVAGDLARARADAAELAGNAAEARALRGAARAAYDRALALRPRSMPLQKKLFGELLQAGLTRPEELDASNREAARKYVRDVLELNPADSDALAWRARLLLLDGEPEDVVELLGDAARADTPPLDLLRLYGAACERTGRVELAADTYSLVLSRMTRRDDARRDDRRAPPDVWADAVRATMRLGRSALAASTAGEAVEAWPDSLDLVLLRSEARHRGGSDAEALAILAAAAQQFPTAREIPLQQARLLMVLSRYDEAERSLRAALVTIPGAGLRTALALVLARQGDIDGMRGELARAAVEAEDASAAALGEGDLLLSIDPPDLPGARAAFERAAAAADDPRAVYERLAELAFVELGRLESPGEGSRAAVEAAVSRCAEAGAAAHVVDYLAGKLALASGDAKTAVTRLERSVAHGEPSTAGLYYLARARRAAGESRKAALLLSQAVEIAPGDRRLGAELALLRADIAASALAEGRPAEALLALESSGGTPRDTILSAVARAARENWEVAEAEARLFLEMRPGDVSGQHLLAAVLVRAGARPHLEEAARIYSALLDDAAGDSRHDVHALVGLASIRGELGEHTAAAEAWEAAADLEPNDRGILRGRVQTLIATGRAVEALGLVEARLAGGRDDRGTLSLHADLLLHAGRLAHAATAYRALADANQRDVRPLLGAAAALTADDRSEEALALLRSRVTRCDEPRAAWRALGDLLALAGRLEDAREAFERAVGGTLPTGYELLLRGGVEEALGEPESARRTYESRTTSVDLRAERWHRLGALQAAAGEVRRAIDTYDALLDIRPEDAVAINNRALLYLLEDGRLPEALAEARRARELDGARPEIADTLGWLLLRSGSPADGLPLLEEASAALPGDARVFYHLGVCLARLGRDGEARQRLENALDLDPAFPEADAARAQLKRLR